MLLRLGLEVADRIVARLPAPAAYAIADLAGEAWHRLSPRRRRLVASNLARVCAATGRPSRGRAFTDLVRAAFRSHARYYLELLRAPHYARDRITDIVEVPDWNRYAEPLRAGRATILISWHLGNFEPFGIYLAMQGFRPLSPIEEIEPRPLFEFLAARRGSGLVDLVPLSRARPALSRRLRGGGLVGIIGDRLLEGGGHEVDLFGHRTAIPIGPATLAVTHDAAVVAGRCLRIGPDRFLATGEVLDVRSSGHRRADIIALTELLAARLERDIAAAPEQWWGAFQPVWPDLGGGDQ